ncbi:MAG: hypothetical protein ACLQQM_02810 [Acidimicrobiales bacterium]
MADRVLRVYLTGDSAGLEASMARGAAATDAASDAMSNSLGGVSKDAEKAPPPEGSGAARRRERSLDQSLLL